MGQHSDPYYKTETLLDVSNSMATFVPHSAYFPKHSIEGTISYRYQMSSKSNWTKQRKRHVSNGVSPPHIISRPSL